jgi:hypothetical protein
MAYQGNAACSAEEFMRLFEAHGACETARILGLDSNKVFERRARLERKLGIVLKSPNASNERRTQLWLPHYEERLPTNIANGIVLAGSDWHIWPGRRSVMFRAYMHLARELQVQIKLLNGDVFDGAKISRHPPSGWNRLPTLKEELEACQDLVGELYEAWPGAQHIWNVGNHDLRFENKLAHQAPEYEGVQGVSLEDHFPAWKFAMSTWFNDGELVTKHRFKGGIHATHQNAVSAGMSILTGHLHSAKVTPVTDYRGRRYGIDSGTMEDIYGPQFAYMEDNPRNHVSAIAVLTFKDGKLLWPELAVAVDDEHFQFRGEVIHVPR